MRGRGCLLDRSSGKTYFKQHLLFCPSIYTLCKVSSFALFYFNFLNQWQFENVQLWQSQIVQKWQSQNVQLWHIKLYTIISASSYFLQFIIYYSLFTLQELILCPIKCLYTAVFIAFTFYNSQYTIYYLQFIIYYLHCRSL